MHVYKCGASYSHDIEYSLTDHGHTQQQMKQIDAERENAIAQARQEAKDLQIEMLGLKKR